ncbi:AAA family ATPase [Streptomyces sp. NPDC003247]|uniref:AAA family ATPase n=1 Tax=Streptomyces sp. NPDC003247 TaxID=3364677 RepID=UPI0036CAF26C
MTGPLREREDAYALFAAETERARAGAGRFVLLRGATGTGRSALLEAAVAHAAGRGLRVLRARCSPEDTAVPFSSVLHLLGPVPEFADMAPGADDRGSAARLWRVLRAYAAESPLLVAVDDVHLADGASRRWLAEAARRVDRLAVLVVATERSQYDVDPQPAGLTHALSPSLVRTHTLAPLTDATAARLVRDAFPTAPDGWTADCVRAGAGSPLLLRALLEDLHGTPPPTAVPATCAALYPGAYPAAVSWWLDSAGPATAEVARTLAALEGSWTPTAEAPAPGGGPAFTEAPAPGGVPSSAEGPFGVPSPAEGPFGVPSPAEGPFGVPSPAEGPFGVPSSADGPFGVPAPADAAGTPVGPPASVYGTDASAVPPAFSGYSTDASVIPPASSVYGAGTSVVPPAPADGTGTAVGRPAGFAGATPAGDGASGSAHGATPPPAHGATAAPVAHGAATTPPPAHGAPARGAPLAPASTPTPAPALAALLADATGADPVRVAGWLTAMTRLGVVRPDADGRPRFAHPLLRDAVLAGWPTARRRAARLAVAEAMLRRGDRAEPVARQLLGSGAVGLPWALRVLRYATAVAVREGRPGDAVAYLRRALAEPLSDELRQRLLTELGSLEYASAGAPAGIPRLAEALSLPAEPRDRVRTAIALGTALAARGEVRTAVDVLNRLEDRLAGHSELVRTVRTASALLSDRDQTVRREAYRWLADAAGRSPELVGATGQALLVRYAATAGASSARSAMARLRTLLTEPADPLAEPFLLGTAAAVAQWADELDEAERLAERGMAGQLPSLLHPMQRALHDVRLDVAAARGRYDLLLAGRAPVDAGPTNADAHALLALVETGRSAEARRLAHGFDLRAAHDSWELNRFLYARGVLRRTEGDATGALHDFLECGRRQSGRGVLSPVVTPWRSAAAECQIALGTVREARALAEEELRLARVWDTPRTVGRALRVLARATGGRHGLELAEEAVALLRTSPADDELIAALLTRGLLLTTAGERARGRESLREAAERAERLGSVRLRTRAEHALRAGGARRSGTARTGSAALTTSERRIAELAAEGRTNTEIADSLHVARRTVETHLTSAYRKLGIRRRGELREALARP